jgi:hypothetical protein
MHSGIPLKQGKKYSSSPRAMVKQIAYFQADPDDPNELSSSDFRMKEIKRR